MRTVIYFVIFSVVLVFSSCKKDQLPDYYGVYAVTGDSLVPIKSQKLQIRSFEQNMLSGIQGTTGILLKGLDKLIVYQRGLDPAKLKLSSLNFMKSRTINTDAGILNQDVMLWIESSEVPILVAPVKNRTDMFTVSLTEPLKDGFYALHFGDLSNQLNSDSPGKVAYDFVVGMTNRVYQPVSDDQFSEEDLLGIDASDTAVMMNEGEVVVVDEVIAEQEFLDKAKELLLSVNNCFNSKNYVELRKSYLNPDKSVLSDQDWSKLVLGFQNWSSKAGNVKSSSVIGFNYDGNEGTLTLQTVYDKMGSVNEFMDVVAIDKMYYLTFIGAR